MIMSGFMKGDGIAERMEGRLGSRAELTRTGTDICEPELYRMENVYLLGFSSPD